MVATTVATALLTITVGPATTMAVTMGTDRTTTGIARTTAAAIMVATADTDTVGAVEFHSRLDSDCYAKHWQGRSG